MKADNMEQDLLQLGGVFVLGMGLLEVVKLLINKFVVKPENKTEFNSEAILDELVKMNGNHLVHVESAIREGNKEVATAINASITSQNAGNLMLAQALGKIEGLLEKKS